MRHKIECAGLAIDVDENGAWHQVRLGRDEVAFPGIAPCFFLAWKLAEAERLWQDGPRWNILPNIRLNYRDYGLDPRTRSALTQVLGGDAQGSSNAEGS